MTISSQSPQSTLVDMRAFLCLKTFTKIDKITFIQIDKTAFTKIDKTG